MFSFNITKTYAATHPDHNTVNKTFLNAKYLTNDNNKIMASDIKFAIIVNFQFKEAVCMNTCFGDMGAILSRAEIWRLQPTQFQNCISASALNKNPESSQIQINFQQI